MTGKLFTTAAAAIALSVTPALAQQGQLDRASALVSQSEALDDHEGNGPGLLLGVLALAAIVGAVLIAAGDEDEVLPTSP